MQKSDLIGVWKLQSFAIQSPDGEEIYPYGKNAKGYLIYTPEGYLSVHIMSSKRPTGGEYQFKKGSNEEKIEAAENYGGYVGTYQLKEDLIIHLAELSGFTRLIGSPERKHVSLSSDQLTISYTDTSSEKTLHGKLIWNKVKT
ncbi:MAG: lipocalin-like domain-containing protein [Chlamydiia bacterium]|nr:lipocalin-like domain-containing protein [Chlamydiia bacterium]